MEVLCHSLSILAQMRKHFTLTPILLLWGWESKHLMDRKVVYFCDCNYKC
jgi:hypothetical protein